MFQSLSCFMVMLFGGKYILWIILPFSIAFQHLLVTDYNLFSSHRKSLNKGIFCFLQIKDSHFYCFFVSRLQRLPSVDYILLPNSPLPKVYYITCTIEQVSYSNYDSSKYIIDKNKTDNGQAISTVK
jgi:hypothetical protein